LVARGATVTRSGPACAPPPGASGTPARRHAGVLANRSEWA